LQGVKVNIIAPEGIAMSTDSADGEPAQPRIEVTEAAAEQALSLLDSEGLDDSIAGLRLFVQQGGCAGLSYGMRFDDEPDEDDKIYEHHDLRVFVDPASLKYVGGSVLDYEQGLQAEGFHVDNPNVVSECGCGESFRT
jgi:iron-sulfur cluster assembly protein